MYNNIGKLLNCTASTEDQCILLYHTPQHRYPHTNRKLLDIILTTLVSLHYAVSARRVEPSIHISQKRSWCTVRILSLCTTAKKKKFKHVLREFGVRIIERDRAEGTKCTEKPQRAPITRVVRNDVSFVYSITRAANRDLRFIRAGRPDGRKIRCRGARHELSLSPWSPPKREGERERAECYFFLPSLYGARHS